MSDPVSSSDEEVTGGLVKRRKLIRGRGQPETREERNKRQRDPNNGCEGGELVKRQRTEEMRTRRKQDSISKSSLERRSGRSAETEVELDKETSISPNIEELDNVAAGFGNDMKLEFGVATELFDELGRQTLKLEKGDEPVFKYPGGLSDSELDSHAEENDDSSLCSD